MAPDFFGGYIKISLKENGTWGHVLSTNPPSKKFKDKKEAEKIAKKENAIIENA